MSGLKSGIILARRNEIVCSMRASLPDQVTVEHHGGEVNLEVIQRYGAKAPAVVVTCMRFDDLELTDQSTGVGFMVFAITSNAPLESHKDLDRHDQALLLAEAVHRIIMSDAFSPPDGCAERPGNLAAVNTYGKALDDKGLALWATAWAEQIRLVEDDAGDLVDLETLWTKFKPEEDPDDTTPSLEFDALKGTG